MNYLTHNVKELHELTNSIKRFNDFCERTQRERVDLQADTLYIYKQSIDNIVRNLYQIPEFNDCFILLYTESLFDALANIRFFPNFLLNNANFIQNNPTAPDEMYYNAIKREFGPDMNRASRNFHAASFADTRTFQTHRNEVQSICEHYILDHEIVENLDSDLLNNIVDAYTVYTANLIQKELVELHNGEEFDVPLILINNKKFFNKIAILRNVENTIINNRLFYLEDLQRNIAFCLNSQDLYNELTRSNRVGRSPLGGGIIDPAYWGNRIVSTVIWYSDIEDPYHMRIDNLLAWLSDKNRTRFNNLPDNFFTHYQEYGAILLNAYRRHNSDYHIYMPTLRTGYSADLSNNSTISYFHKFSHQLFAGGYQTLVFGPIFTDYNHIYNPHLLNTFSLNYRISSNINQLISSLQRQQANPTEMTNAPRHRAWQGDRYHDNMERYNSIIKSVEHACNIGMHIQPDTNGILPLIHRLPLFHGSEVNLFQDNGQYTYTRGFLSCTTTIDIALSFASNGDQQVYVYLILIEEGEHCPFINMGNMFREFAIPPGVILTRVGDCTLPELNWRQPRINGNNITFVFVRPAIGNFVQEFTRLIDIANMWEPYLEGRTCYSNYVYDQNPQRDRIAPNMRRYFTVFNTYNVAQNTIALRNELQYKIPAFPLHIGGGKKNNKKFEKKLKELENKKNIFPLLKTDTLFKTPKLSKIKISTNKSSVNKKDECKHFNSLTKYGLFETFKTKKELQEFVINENQKIKDQIVIIRKKIEESKKLNKDSMKKSNKSIKISKNKENAFDLSLLDKKGNDVFDKETQKILSLAGKGSF